MKNFSIRTVYGSVSRALRKLNVFGGGFRGAVTESLFVFFLIFVRYLPFGFTYNWQLDDYIQYKIYASTPLAEACSKYGLLAARPLSNTADIFFWGRFACCFILAVLLISAMYAVAVVIMRRIFHRYFGTGALFTVVAAIIPLAFEGTYWLSASTRIVCGLFYAALSALFLHSYLISRKKRYLPFLIVFQLAAMFSYEQALLFTAALNIALPVLYGTSQNKGEGKLGLKTLCQNYFAVPLVFVNCALYFAFIGIFSESALYGSAYSTADLFSVGFFTHHVPATVFKIAKVFVLGGFATFIQGFWQGMLIVIRQGLLWYGIAALVLSALLGKLATDGRSEERSAGKLRLESLIVSVWLFLAPTAVFFVMAEPYFSVRNAVMCLPGLALAADTIAGALFRKPTLYGVATGLIAVVCMFGSVNEINGYAETTKNDTCVINAIVDALPVEELCGKIGILNVEESYINEVVRINEHITGVTSSYWALTGAVNATLDCEVTGKVTIVPLPFETPMSYGWNRDMNDVASFDRIFLYSPDEGGLIEVAAVPNGEAGYTFVNDAGENIARAYSDGECVYGELLK